MYLIVIPKLVMPYLIQKIDTSKKKELLRTLNVVQVWLDFVTISRHFIEFQQHLYKENLA